MESGKLITNPYIVAVVFVEKYQETDAKNKRECKIGVKKYFHQFGFHLNVRNDGIFRNWEKDTVQSCQKNRHKKHPEGVGRSGAKVRKQFNDILVEKIESGREKNECPLKK